MSGARSDGVRDLMDLKDRSVIDDETGCWVVSGYRSQGGVWLWLPQAGQVVSLTAAMGWLMTGRKAATGTMWVPKCGDPCCGNPAHRVLGDRSMLMRILRPKLDPLHRSKIQRAQLANSPHYSEELRREILSSTLSGRELAELHGIHRSVVSKVRQGKAWNSAARGSSVFGIGRST